MEQTLLLIAFNTLTGSLILPLAIKFMAILSGNSWNVLKFLLISSGMHKRLHEQGCQTFLTRRWISYKMRWIHFITLQRLHCIELDHQISVFGSRNVFCCVELDNKRYFRGAPLTFRRKFHQLLSWILHWHLHEENLQQFSSFQSPLPKRFMRCSFRSFKIYYAVSTNIRRLQTRPIALGGIRRQ